MRNKVIVVVPLYRDRLMDYEYIALEQVYSILNNYNICFIVPDSFVELNKIVKDREFLVERFSDYYFRDTSSYSELCMSTEFYNRFYNFEYILIYQLDAFVFEDRLIEFCNMKYDYFGAPVPSWCWERLGYHVGNGGFSLRKVSRCLDVVTDKERIFEKFRKDYGKEKADEIKKIEDCFFGYCGFKDDIEFTVPDIDTALSFSVEFNINGIYKDLEDHLPFGCHRWHTNRFDKWWPIISKYGYDLNNGNAEARIHAYPWYEYKLLVDQVHSRGITKDEQDTILTIVGENCVRIWGYGEDGVKFRRVLEGMGLNVVTVFDKRSKTDEMIEYPLKASLLRCKYPVIITSTKYAEEIASEIEGYGLVEGETYFKYYELMLEIINTLGLQERGERIPS